VTHLNCLHIEYIAAVEARAHRFVLSILSVWSAICCYAFDAWRTFTLMLMHLIHLNSTNNLYCPLVL
jgi:hypothetical protein